MHGAHDPAGLVVRLHHRGCHHAAIGHARQGKGQDQVRRAQGKKDMLSIAVLWIRA